MTFELTLPGELKGRLRGAAQRQGLAPDAVTLKLLDQYLPAVEERQPVEREVAPALSGTNPR